MTDLKTLIETYLHNHTANLYTSIPASVVKVNSNGDSIESVDCRPCIQETFSDGVVAESPVVYSVPVIFPSAGGGILSFPVSVGDTVLLCFGMRDMDNFLDGNIDQPAPTQRLHNMTDGVAIVGLYPTKDNLEPSTKDVELKYKGSKVKISNNGDISLEASTVKIKGNLEVEGDSITHNNVEVGGKHVHIAAGAATTSANQTPQNT